MSPLSAFLITRDTERSATQGAGNSVLLLYSAANFLCSSGGPQPCLGVSQQLRALVVLSAGSQQLVAETEKSWGEKPVQQRLLIQRGKVMRCLFRMRPQCHL